MRYRADGSDHPLSFNTCKTKRPCSEEGNTTHWEEFALLKGRLGKNLFLWLKNLMLSETCSVQANVCLDNGRVNEVNWLNLSESASASTKPKTNLTNWVSLFEVHSGPKCCVVLNKGKITLSLVSGPLWLRTIVYLLGEKLSAIYSYEAVFWK